MPKTTTGSHLIEPVNPFKPFKTDRDYMRAIKEHYTEELNDEEL